MLVIVLVALLAFGCEIQAKSDQSIDRNRRDAQSFYRQIKKASKLDESCYQRKCASSADPTACPGFCKRDERLIDRAIIATSNCLSSYTCNLHEWNLSQVKIPIGIEGYDGVCSLSGNVTVSGGNIFEFSTVVYDENYSTSFPSYQIYSVFTLTYSGLSVTCSPCTSSSGGSGNGLLNQILNRRSSGSKFNASVTVTQGYKVDFVNVFFTSSVIQKRFSVTTSVELGSGVPAEYEEQVEAVVKTQLNDFDLIDYVGTNYIYNINEALQATYKTTCLQSSCETA